MNDNKFFLGVWSLAAVVLIALFASVAAYNIHSNVVVERLVKGGADPQKAACSVTDNRATVCAVLATKQ